MPVSDGLEEQHAGTVIRPRAELVVVGTGIRVVGQLTTEAIAWMRNADELLHVVADPVAEAVMTQLHPGARSLRCHYAPGKPRADTYEEMVEDLLGSVREGKLVVAAFYGHPGVFAWPSHEAVRRARREGYPARMLPGISAEDCLFAELGVDPAENGCQSYEATDFVMHARVIDPSAQLILWQAGLLGDWRYSEGEYDLGAFPLLVERLLEHYPAGHEVVIYQAAVAGWAANVQRVPLERLTADLLNAGSTLYLAPAVAPAPHPRNYQRFEDWRNR